MVFWVVVEDVDQCKCQHIEIRRVRDGSLSSRYWQARVNIAPVVDIRKGMRSGFLPAQVKGSAQRLLYHTSILTGVDHLGKSGNLGTSKLCGHQRLQCRLQLPSRRHIGSERHCGMFGSAKHYRGCLLRKLCPRKSSIGT